MTAAQREFGQGGTGSSPEPRPAPTSDVPGKDTAGTRSAALVSELRALLDALDAAKHGYMADTIPPGRYVVTSKVRGAERRLQEFVVKRGREIEEALNG